MDSKYQKTAIKEMLLMPTKSKIECSEKNRNYGKRKSTKKFPKSFIIGIISGLCFSKLHIFSFPKLSSFYQYNETSRHQQDQDKLSRGIEDKTMANRLFNEVRVLCWIMTGPDNHETKAQHVKNTWGPRCNKLLFMSTAEDTKLGTIVLPVPEGREELWAKTKEAFKYIYQHHFDEYDWFLKADDDTYVVMENLRKMLYAYNTEFPIYLGCRRREIVKQGFMHGGAGYVLGKETLKRFIEKGIPDENKCRQENGGMEDVELAKCMENIGVYAGDSRDEYERGRMFADPPERLLIPEPAENTKPYWKAFYYKSDPGPKCCSEHAISFHYIQPSGMYELDYLIYQLRPFGITHSADILPQKKSLDELISVLTLPSINSIK